MPLLLIEYFCQTAWKRHVLKARAALKHTVANPGNTTLNRNLLKRSAFLKGISVHGSYAAGNRNAFKGCAALKRRLGDPLECAWK